MMHAAPDIRETESLRLFYAVWPDEETRAALVRLQNAVEGRKTLPRNLHMTLAFLGQQPRTLLPVLQEILMQLPDCEFMLELDRLDHFKRKRIAWAGSSRTPDALGTLQHRLVQALAQHGITFDQQAQFQPHVTLAREVLAPLDALFPVIRWRADQVALVQSVSQTDGIFYRVLSSCGLK